MSVSCPSDYHPCAHTLTHSMGNWKRKRPRDIQKSIKVALTGGESLVLLSPKGTALMCAVVRWTHVITQNISICLSVFSLILSISFSWPLQGNGWLIQGLKWTGHSDKFIHLEFLWRHSSLTLGKLLCIWGLGLGNIWDNIFIFKIFFFFKWTNQCCEYFLFYAS